jgi:hypothetical protein
MKEFNVEPVLEDSRIVICKRRERLIERKTVHNLNGNINKKQVKGNM